MELDYSIITSLCSDAVAEVDVAFAEAVTDAEVDAFSSSPK